MGASFSIWNEKTPPSGSAAAAPIKAQLAANAAAHKQARWEFDTSNFPEFVRFPDVAERF